MGKKMTDRQQSREEVRITAPQSVDEGKESLHCGYNVLPVIYSAVIKLQ